MKSFTLLLSYTLIICLAGPAHGEEGFDHAPKNQNHLDKLNEEDRFSIFRYKPIYFAYANPLTKVHFSFRTPILRDHNFFFAYSQIIFWKLHEESKPFLDATYNPEFFYRYDMDSKGFTHIDFGLWEHNSNGQDGDTSRSYDQTYVRANYALEFKSLVLILSGKLRLIYNVDDTNRDIIDYTGPLTFEMKLIHLFSGIFDKSELTLNLNPGGKFSDDFSRGGYQISYSFRLGGLKLVPAFYLQYYEGYAETLINYDERVQEFRAGFTF